MPATQEKEKINPGDLVRYCRQPGSRGQPISVKKRKAFLGLVVKKQPGACLVKWLTWVTPADVAAYREIGDFFSKNVLWSSELDLEKASE